MTDQIVGGNKPPTTADRLAPETPERQRAIDTLYDGNAAQTPASPDGNALYGSFSTVTSPIDGRFSELAIATGATEADQTRLRDEFVGIAKKTGLNEGFVANLAEHHLNNLLADARIEDDPLAAEVALDKQSVEWKNETRARLRNTYGAKDAEDLLARTQKFVKSTPALAKILQKRGLGNRPDVVQAIVSHVFSTGYR
jgi:hypothetical protein